MEIELERFELRFREPLRTAYGTLDRRELLQVHLRDADGAVGVGEAAPLEGYDGVSVGDVRADLEAGGGDPARWALPQSSAALDMALLDMEGRRRGAPVAALLSSDAAPAVAVNATIGATEPATAAAAAAAAAARGFRCVKVKAGIGDDLTRVAAVRDALGAGAAIRLDANGAWTVDEAVRILRDLASLDIELCEEPVHGVEKLREVRARLGGVVAIAMDETVTREAAAVASGACDYVCLKVSSSGGVRPLLAVAESARAAGSEVYLASTFDGPLGIAAGLHAAAALAPRPPCGLATLSLFEGIADPFPLVDGAIAVPDGPGLGVTPLQ